MPLTCENEPPWGVEPQTYALRELSSPHTPCSLRAFLHVKPFTVLNETAGRTPFRSTNGSTFDLACAPDPGRGRGESRPGFLPISCSSCDGRRTELIGARHPRIQAGRREVNLRSRFQRRPASAGELGTS